MCVYVYMYVHICMYMCVYVYVYVCVCIHMYMYMCVYVYMCVCVYIFIYVYIYVNIYIYLNLLVQFSRLVVSDSLQPMNRSTPGFPVHHQLPELAQTHVHRVSNAIQPSLPLLSPSPPAFNLSQHQGLFH